MRNGYQGILPAMQCPMKENFEIDYDELQRFANWLVNFKGVNGLVTNGHTGEIFSLSPKERAEVTKAVVEAVNGKVPVISGIAVEGIQEGIDQAAMLKDAGADGLLVMPFHHWLRFGFSPDHVIEYFSDLGKTSGLNLVAHIYPAWTKANYNSNEIYKIYKKQELFLVKM